MLNVLKKYLFGFAEKVCFHSRSENIHKYSFQVNVHDRNLRMSIGLRYVQLWSTDLVRISPVCFFLH